MQKHLGGILGLILALILETVLFISRANLTPGLGTKYEALLDPKRHEQKRQKATPSGDAFQTMPAAAHAQEAARDARPLHAEPKKKR